MKIRIFAACSAFLFLLACNTNPDHGSKSLPQYEPETLNTNKAIARTWFEQVINQRNLDALDDAYAVDYIHHGTEGVDIEGLDASSDRQATVDQQVAEGNLVATRFTSSGHLTGEFNGIEPTDKIWTTKGIVISRIEDGKIVEDWEIVNISGL